MLATTGIPIFSAFCRIQRTRLEEGGQNDDNVDTSPCVSYRYAFPSFGRCRLGWLWILGYNLDNTGLTVKKSGGELRGLPPHQD